MLQSIIHPRGVGPHGLGLWVSLLILAGVGLGVILPSGRTEAAPEPGLSRDMPIPGPQHAPDNDPTLSTITRWHPPASFRFDEAPGDEVFACDFSNGMTRPELISGAEVRYTPEAIKADVRGISIARCTLTQEGTVKDCRIIKSLPHMDEAVIQALESRRYRPVLLHGKPIRVSYTFNMRLAAP